MAPQLPVKTRKGGSVCVIDKVEDCMSPLDVQRPLRQRAMTLPAINRQSAQEPFVGIRLPHSFAVRQQLLEEGPSTTLLDVALGILARMRELPGMNEDELTFLQDCIKAGVGKTAVPCSLLPGVEGTDEIKDSLLTLFSGGASPSSPARSSRASSRKASIRRLLTSVDPLLDYAPEWSVSMPDVDSLKFGSFMEANFGTWSFDVFELSRLTGGHPLQCVGWEALRSLGAFMELDLDAGKAQSFLSHAEASYAQEMTVPYHNNLHAADVTQLVHALLCDHGFAAYFDELGMLALVLSAIVHDMGHDGRSNNFHTNTQDGIRSVLEEVFVPSVVLFQNGLALLYNDRSVLENHHVSSAFRLLSGSTETDLLSGLPREQFMQLRKEMIFAVLGTDMASHFERVSSFKGYVETLGCEPDQWAADPAALSELQSALLHAADIANPAKPAALSLRWTEMLTEEFFFQGDEELRLGLPISPLCDRKAGHFARSQVGFINIIAQPTFALLAQVSEQVETGIMPLLHENLALWEARSKAEEEAEEVAAAHGGA